MSTSGTQVWDRYLSEADRAVLARGRFAQRMGFGARPAIVVIDAQRYMVGERGIRDERYPSSCGEIGWAAVDRIATILDAGRAAGVPVFLTRFALNASGNDIGVYGRKRAFMFGSRWAYLVAAFALMMAVYGITRWMHRGRLGLYLIAVRDDEATAASMGINTVRVKLIVTMICC